MVREPRCAEAWAETGALARMVGEVPLPQWTPALCAEAWAEMEALSRMVAEAPLPQWTPALVHAMALGNRYL
ncbi:hypothetical protein T484DRAFT_1773842 [Baffinella frigidus]|nr:hypothetical protein T484DRAFT_1773842 [Cryptophyta sp. CCMP2293]